VSWSPIVYLSVRLLHFRLSEPVMNFGVGHKTVNNQPINQNQWFNSNQSWHKSSLEEWDSKLFKWIATLLSKGK
jgi:hypothetical protein